jgi:hypothetical protein
MFLLMFLRELRELHLAQQIDFSFTPHMGRSFVEAVEKVW